MDIGRRSLARVENDRFARRVVPIARDNPQHFVERHDAGNRDCLGDQVRRLRGKLVALRRALRAMRAVNAGSRADLRRRQHTFAGLLLNALDRF